MYCNHPKLIMVALVAFALPMEGTAQVRRSFDAESYFKTLDRNGDEKLDKNELNPKATAYLKKIGMNLDDDRIKLRSISKQLNKNKEASDKQVPQSRQQKTGQALKVPPFGVEGGEELDPVAGFGDPGSAGEIKFSEATIDRVNSTLRRYDRNQDGILDQEESKKGRWGNPDPSESDLNGDGMLSREELMRRYHAREQEQDRQRSESRSGDNSGGRTDYRQKKEEYRRKQESDRSSSNRSRTKSQTSSTRSSNRSPSNDRARYETYAESLLKLHDKDKDKRLSKEEWKKVRRPPANADQNKDGFVTQKEYANALQVAAEKGTSSVAKTRSSKASSNVRTSTGSKSSSSSKSKSSNKSKSGSKSGAGDLSKLDKDSDNQVQMHEYSSDWDDKKLKEFYAIDKNKDGVITLTEWESK